MIGDHQQLRPATSVYELARKFYMDISLFERMINNNMHCVTLTTQYRMRSEIANLIRPIIYKDLLDDESVKQYPNVIGMAKNLYFIDHKEPESGVSINFIVILFFVSYQFLQIALKKNNSFNFI